MPYPMVATITGKPQGSASSLLTSLAAYWKLDEASGTRADSLGVSSLTDNNTVTQNPGKVGNAAQFTAANSESLSCADNAALSTGDSDMTIAAWVYFDTLPAAGNRMEIMSKWGVGAANREYTLYCNNVSGTIRIGMEWRDVGNVQASTFGAPSTGTWYLVSAKRDKTNSLLSISINNGTANTSANATAGIDSATGFLIGASNGSGSPGNFFNGRIDEVAFWKRLTTAAELTRLYNAGAGVTYPTF